MLIIRNLNLISVQSLDISDRVAMIHEESTPCQWRHVDICANLADIASRGAKGSELHKLELWLLQVLQVKRYGCLFTCLTMP